MEKERCRTVAESCAQAFRARAPASLLCGLLSVSSTDMECPFLDITAGMVGSRDS